jgi:hypothetical protein
MEESRETFSKFEGSRKLTGKDGWISPAGVFYNCSPEEHDILADYILRDKKVYIEGLLEKNAGFEIWDKIKELSPREVIKSAGYALLSGNILSEQNLPETLSKKQMRFIHDNQMVFAPESSRLQPSVYLELKKRIQENKNLPSILQILKFCADSYAEEKFKNFIKNPYGYFHVFYLNGEESEEIRSFFSFGEDEEIYFESPWRNTYTWTPIRGLADEDVFLEYSYHLHNGGEEPYQEEGYKFVGKKAIKNFLDEYPNSRHLISGNIDILD